VVSACNNFFHPLTFSKMTVSKLIPLVSTRASEVLPDEMLRFDFSVSPDDKHMIVARVLTVTKMRHIGSKSGRLAYDVMFVTDLGTTVVTADAVVYVHPDMYSEQWQVKQYQDDAPLTPEMQEADAAFDAMEGLD